MATGDPNGGDIWFWLTDPETGEKIRIGTPSEEMVELGKKLLAEHKAADERKNRARIVIHRSR